MTSDQAGDDVTPLVKAENLWMNERPDEPGVLDIYSTEYGSFEPADGDPSRFEYHPAGWDALAREIAEEPLPAGEKQYVHGTGHIEGAGPDAEIWYDDVVRGAGVAGDIQPPEGWF